MMETGVGIDWAMAEALAMGWVLYDFPHYIIFSAGTVYHEISALA